MSLKNYAKFKYIAIIGILLGSLGCQGESDSAAVVTTVSFTAKLDANLSIQKGIGDIGDISQIIALALDGNDFKEDKTQSTPIEVDGTFNIALSQDQDWVLLTENPNATTLVGRIGNFLSLSQDQTRLTVFPLENASGNIDMGLLSSVEDETSSENSISSLSSNLGISTSSLIELANIDILTKGVKNNYINTDKTTGVKFRYNFEYYLDVTNAPAYYNQDTNISKYLLPNQIYFDLRTTHPALDFGKTSYFISPSENNVTVVLNDNIDGVEQIVLPFSEPEKGYYKLNDDGNITVAVFDLYGVDLVENNKFAGILPVIKLLVNDNNSSSQLKLSFYTYDVSKADYVQLLDKSILTKYLQVMWLDLLNYGVLAQTYLDVNFRAGSYTINYNGTALTKSLLFVDNEYTIEFGRTITDIPAEIEELRCQFFLEGKNEYGVTFSVKP